MYYVNGHVNILNFAKSSVRTKEHVLSKNLNHAPLFREYAYKIYLRECRPNCISLSVRKKAFGGS